RQALSILKDEKVLKEFKERAAIHASRFDIHNVVPLYEKLYEKFL
ncbi:MAG: N-acetyl-alpha-D-glucosaminyl L-malate synthase BshA, partial [Chitinophagaceae bacterium]|nr:N-acetyl-alpha-D-glucosaminyl L-malate synthase BshA [Chitinophagaceae bacterium]